MKLIIADSNILIRAGLNAVLSQYADIEIVGEASSEKQLLEMAKSFQPDVVLIDFAAQHFSIDVVPAIQKHNK
ncbi:MAG: response regulator transcription factor, partial [Flavobacteriales bacterium]